MFAGDDATQPGTAADAGYRLYQFRSEEDPTFAGAPNVCKGDNPTVPFTPNLFLNATIWTTNARASDGLTVTNANRQIGTATACGRLEPPTVPGFPAGAQVPFHVAFDTPAGRITATGTCAVVSNSVPAAGIVLAGCNLKVVGMPTGFTGGEATSASILNAARIPGVSTGSYWTVLLYGDPA
jgi:hypothetical protein